MKTLTKAFTGLLISGIAAASIFATPVFAKGDFDDKRTQKIERLAEKLALSDAQTVSFVEIMEAQGEKRQALREEIKAKRDALRTETIASLETVLSEEQVNAMEELMERNKKKRNKK